MGAIVRRRPHQPTATAVLSLSLLVLGTPTTVVQHHLSNPVQRRMEFVFRARSLEVKAPTAELHVWMAEPLPGVGQSDTCRLSITPPPTQTFDDPENGNRILYWNLSPTLVSDTTIEIRRKYELTSWRVDGVPGPEENIAMPDPEDPLVRFYTKSERWLEQNDEIRALADELTRDWEQPWEKISAIFDWVKGSCEYVYPPPGGRGSLVMLLERKGDCGQYACLFINLCRAAGIPARFVAGVTVGDEGRVGHHAWAEVWLPGPGWIPCDPTGTRKDPVGTIDSGRIVTTRGLNIPLPQVPAWANYDNSEVTSEGKNGMGRTEFIQNACVATRGVRANFATRRIAEKVILWDGLDHSQPVQE